MNMNITILLVEDTQKMHHTIRDYLQIQGYRVLSAFDGRQALEICEQMGQVIDLVLLDLMLPVISGYEVLRELRKRSDLPVIILSAKSEVEDQMRGFSIGADDYLVKPFSLKLMKMHIDAVLKRAGKLQETIQCGEIAIDLSSYTVRCSGQVLTLTRKEFELLVYLVQHKGMVLTRSSIIDSVWGYDYIGETRTVDTIVKQLRRKLPKSCDYIRTIYGVGYKWEESVE